MAERVWFGTRLGARAGRAALWPASVCFRGSVALRNLAYDRRLLRARAGAIPAIGVGNLTVGGTGKTPVAAWLAGELARRGAHPAIVLRGYGGDEPLVHERLNPGVPVVVASDRLGGLAEAARRGADIGVLDDAFQHRRAARLADVVLVAAERGLTPARLLPAGPYREPPASLRRASLVVVTRKTASPEQAAAVLARATGISGGPGAVVHLAPGALVWTAGGGEGAVPADLTGRRVVLLTGVGEPGLVRDQLAGLGARVELQAYPDHHAFSNSELARAAGAAGGDAAVVCTLKDAVRIGARWTGSVPLWYVSQRLTIDQGAEHLARLLDAAMAAAVRWTPPTAG
ncbi:MAG: tetraacyldisaccharide 4'-kinase [Gemmatimonadota bacterium]|nr:tetraacyldisaccharide 4'-kinase [Gemmatimonadota bacterium]